MTGPGRPGAVPLGIGVIQGIPTNPECLSASSPILILRLANPSVVPEDFGSILLWE